MQTTQQALNDLIESRRDKISHIGKTYRTEFGGAATVEAVRGNIFITASGLEWKMKNSILVTPFPLEV